MAGSQWTVAGTASTLQRAHWWWAPAGRDWVLVYGHFGAPARKRPIGDLLRSADTNRFRLTGLLCRSRGPRMVTARFCW